MSDLLPSKTLFTDSDACCREGEGDEANKKINENETKYKMTKPVTRISSCKNISMKKIKTSIDEEAGKDEMNVLNLLNLAHPERTK
jgi:hypothetical protein